MAKEIEYSADARARLKRGVDQLAEAVKVLEDTIYPFFLPGYSKVDTAECNF